MSRTVALSLAIFAFLALAMAALLRPEGRQSTADAKLGLALPGLAAQINTIESIEFSDAQQTLKLMRVEGRWQFADLPELPVKQAKVRESLLGLANIELVEAKTDNPKFHSALGLTGDATKVQIGADFNLLIGKATNQSDRFIRRGDDSQSYRATSITSPPLGRKAWTDLRVPTVRKETVVKVTISDGDAPYSVTTGADGPTLDGKTPDETLAYDGVLNSVLAGAEYLDFEDVKLASDIEWTAAETAVFATESGVMTYTVATAGERFWLRAEPSEGLMPSAPKDFNWAQWAFELSEYRKQTLLKPRQDLIAAAADAP
ncbi:MAG: DUF4340 domain-containing protein [Pseudomonadota bacterium]